MISAGERLPVISIINVAFEGPLMYKTFSMNSKTRKNAQRNFHVARKKKKKRCDNTAHEHFPIF